MIRRYLAYCPDEEPRIFRMLDLIYRSAQGHGPVHLLLISPAEWDFAWDGAISRGAQGHGPVHLLLICGAELGFAWAW